MHLGPLAQLQDAHGDVEQLVFGDLEQLVAREGVQDMRQRLAVMAGGGKPGALHHVRHLAAQQRNVARPAAVGAGGEQADKAALAGRAPSASKILTPT